MKSRQLPLAILGASLLLSAAASAQKMETAVPESAAAAKPLEVGSKAPSAKLKGLDGKEIKLKDVLAGKPTVLIFYRGDWCPYCNAHLADLAKVEGDLKGLGYQIVAISPDSPSELQKTVDKHKLDFTLLSDTQAKSLKRYGVAFRVDDGMFGMMKDKYNIDLERSSGEKHHILPVPSVFLIDKDGKIVFVHSNPDYKLRMKGDEILAAAKSASASKMR